MSKKSRRFSQISDDPTSPESVGVFRNRSSLSSMKEYGCESKRCKTTGLNSRFDRMIDAMNATHHPPLRSRRRRTHTVSSSNASDLPQTPMDAYKGLEDGRLGENFSLIKMKSPSASGSEVSRMKSADNASSSQISRRPSLDAGIKALPQWLCSTFSTLPAKHPLRLLLPERPSNTQYTSMTLSPALIARPNSQTQPETDPIFAFSLYQPTGNIQGDESANQVDENEAAHHMLLSTNIARTPPFRGSLFGVQKYLLPHQLPPSPDHVLSPPGILPFSTPGPNSVVSQPCVSASMFRSTTGDSQMDARGPSLPPGFDELDFVPFLTPGPVSTLSSASDTVSHGLHSAYDSDPQDCLVDNVSLAQSPHISPFLLHGPSASHTAQPVSPNGSPLCLPVDLCLPPYNAPSDPAPAYSSEDIPEYSYYEDPLTDDHDSSSRPLFDQPSCVASNLPNTSTYSGSEYRTDGPIYFDSPTEDPSDSDPLEPGYDIDYGAIDFKWEPFNRKGISESQRTPSIKPHHDPYSIYQGSQDPGLDYADITQHRGCSNVASLTPERVPSPSPFRFSPNQFMSRGIVAPPPAHEPSPQVDPSDTPEPQLLAPAFAPAPGIFISPLRGEPAASLSPLPQNMSRSGAPQPQEELKRDSEPFNSQASDDSIQSWRDVDAETLSRCLLIESVHGDVDIASICGAL